MFRLASGYAIAKKLGRTFFFSVLKKRLLDMLHNITSAFPRTADKFIVRMESHLETRNWIPPNTVLQIRYIANNTPVDVPVTFATKNGNLSCWEYDDPLRLSNLSGKYLLLETYCAQNVRFFIDYLPEVRDMFRFSDAVRAEAENIIKCRQMQFVNTTCVHTRRGDFVKYNRTTNLDETVEAAMQVSQRHESEQFLIFGDDENFKNRLRKRLQSASGSNIKKTHLSTYNEFEEMYLSSQLCTSFLISNAMSTFGWWLAFFSPNQDSVYYTNDQRTLRKPDLMEGVPSTDLFL
ncbi:hypothetical protein Aduo_014761 [Ancylostoma duodenale]